MTFLNFVFINGIIISNFTLRNAFYVTTVIYLVNNFFKLTQTFVLVGWRFCMYLMIIVSNEKAKCLWNLILSTFSTLQKSKGPTLASNYQYTLIFNIFSILMLHTTKDRQHANRDTALVLLIQTVDNIALKKACTDPQNQKPPEKVYQLWEFST